MKAYEVIFRAGQHKFQSKVVLAESIEEAIAKVEAKGHDVTGACSFTFENEGWD